MSDDKKAISLVVFGAGSSVVVVLLLLLTLAFWVDSKVCPSCEGIGRFIVACRYCDGDGKVSFGKLWLTEYAKETKEVHTSPQTNPAFNQGRCRAHYGETRRHLFAGCQACVDAEKK